MFCILPTAEAEVITIIANKRAGAYVSVFLARSPTLPKGAGAVIPHGERAFFRGFYMDKESREALQVAKELTCKFIETRTVSPGNFAEVFPVIYRVVAQTICEGAKEANTELDN